MKYIKIYEDYNFFLLKIDIDGIFIDLKDLGFSISFIPCIENSNEYFLLEINTPDGLFDFTSYKYIKLVRECILMYLDYMKYRYKKITIKYEYYYLSGRGTTEVVNARTLLLYPKYTPRLKGHVYKINIKIKKK